MDETTTQDRVVLKHGSLENLPPSGKEGVLYFCDDVGRLFKGMGEDEDLLEFTGLIPNYDEDEEVSGDDEKLYLSNKGGLFFSEKGKIKPINSTHEKSIVASKNGAHGLRYYEDRLEIKSEEKWIEIKIGTIDEDGGIIKQKTKLEVEAGFTTNIPIRDITSFKKLEPSVLKMVNSEQVTEVATDFKAGDETDFEENEFVDFDKNRGMFIKKLHEFSMREHLPKDNVYKFNMRQLNKLTFLESIEVI